MFMTRRNSERERFVTRGQALRVHQSPISVCKLTSSDDIKYFPPVLRHYLNELRVGPMNRLFLTAPFGISRANKTPDP